MDLSQIKDVSKLKRQVPTGKVNETTATGKSISRPQFTIMSLNLDSISNGNREGNERGAIIYQLTSLIKDKQPYVVALQSVDKASLQKLYELLESYYQIFQVFKDDSECHKGDVLFLHREKVKIVEPYYHDYDSRITSENRKVICCRLEFPHIFEGERFNIMTTELEKAFDRENFRVQQFEMLRIVSQKRRNIILPISLNTYDDELEPVCKNILQSRFKDAWVESGCSLPLKITCDYGHLGDKEKSSRFRRPDRLFYYSTQKLFKLVSFGKMAISNRGHRILIATFEKWT